MKYIRTKDNFYTMEQLKDIMCPSPENPLRDYYSYLCERGLIVDQGDNLETICDEYIYEYDDFMHHTQFIEYAMQEMEWNKIYGAVWVKGEKGEPILKSIAKMNEKGELELL